MPKNKITFEEKLDVINQEIAKRKVKWRLSSLAWLNFDDVSQMLRIHIWKKWSYWDSSKPLEPWLNRIITHQITNLVRNIYSNFARPCLKCAANQGAELCSMTPSGKQCIECPLYAKWVKRKKSALDTKLPLSMDDDVYLPDVKNQVESVQSDFLDYDHLIPQLHKKMQEHLKPNEYKVYHLLYIDNLSEEEVAQKMGYKTTENNRRPGYKWIQKLRIKIVGHAKNVCREIME